MKRLLKSTYGDMFMQMKYGFYLVYGIISVIYIVMLNQFSYDIKTFMLSIIIFSDPALLGFYFIGGLVLLEKGENTLEYLIVTPLRSKEYLFSKIISLTILSLIASIVISLLTYGIKFNILLLLIGVSLTSILFILIGFIVVAKYPTINKYFLSSIVYITILCIPIIDYLELYKNKILYIFPTQASLLLIKGSFLGLESWKVAYSISYLIISIFVTYRWALHSFNKFIVRKEGVK